METPAHLPCRSFQICTCQQLRHKQATEGKVAPEQLLSLPAYLPGFGSPPHMSFHHLIFHSLTNNKTFPSGSFSLCILTTARKRLDYFIGPTFNQIQNALSEIKGVCLGFFYVEIRYPSITLVSIGNFPSSLFHWYYSRQRSAQLLPHSISPWIQHITPFAQPSPPTSGGCGGPACAGDEDSS